MSDRIDNRIDTRIDTREEWYFDLERGIAVRASERGPGDRMLGPYPTRGHAENWKATVESRNTAWDDADHAWDGDPDRPSSDD